MKTILLTFAALSIGLSAPAANDESVLTNSPAEQIGANHSNAIENRTRSVLNGLALADPIMTARVHDIVYAQCQALRAWHDENDPKIKAARSDTNAVAQIQASLKQLHNEFIAKLSKNLTQSQVEMIKDGMTHGVVRVTCSEFGRLRQSENPGTPQGRARRGNGLRNLKRKGCDHQKIQGQNQQLPRRTRSQCRQSLQELGCKTKSQSRD